MNIIEYTITTYHYNKKKHEATIGQEATIGLSGEFSSFARWGRTVEPRVDTVQAALDTAVGRNHTPCLGLRAPRGAPSRPKGGLPRGALGVSPAKMHNYTTCIKSGAKIANIPSTRANHGKSIEILHKA